MKSTSVIETVTDSTSLASLTLTEQASSIHSMKWASGQSRFSMSKRELRSSSVMLKSFLYVVMIGSN